MTQELFTESLAAWIRKSRKELGMTQLHVAMAIGVRRSTVAAWERGSRMPGAYRHLQLRECFRGGGDRVSKAVRT